MQPSVFISYRRADTGGHAGRLFDRLSRWFDAGEVDLGLVTRNGARRFLRNIHAAIHDTLRRCKEF